jgi:hypothetical protein
VVEVTTSWPALSCAYSTAILSILIFGSTPGSEKNAWPACRQVGPIRKNQSRPASVRNVAGLSALMNGTSNRSARWLAASVTSGS